MAEKILMNEFKQLAKETWTNISLINENIYEWSVALIVLNPDSPYYGGYFKCRMAFPHNASSALSGTQTSTPTAASASPSCTSPARTQ
jgi:hypothetical protein